MKLNELKTDEIRNSVKNNVEDILDNYLVDNFMCGIDEHVDQILDKNGNEHASEKDEVVSRHIWEKIYEECKYVLGIRE